MLTVHIHSADTNGHAWQKSMRGSCAVMSMFWSIHQKAIWLSYHWALSGGRRNNKHRDQSLCVVCFGKIYSRRCCEGGGSLLRTVGNTSGDDLSKTSCGRSSNSSTWSKLCAPQSDLQWFLPNVSPQIGPLVSSCEWLWALNFISSPRRNCAC